MGWNCTDDTRLVRAWIERYRRLSILENVLVARANTGPTLLPTLMFTKMQADIDSDMAEAHI